tara:strand:+ start:1093 stop:1515 length:423 start_codon:yes stop_codon:yes gene_type:complete
MNNQISLSTPPPLTQDIKDHFKTSVMSWLEIDVQIEEYKKKIKELRNRKNKEIEPEIMNFMKTYNISDLNTQNGRLKYSERNIKKPINKKSLMENLILYYNNNEEKAEEVTNFIYDNREEKSVHKITKLKAKKMPLNMTG